jgi:hypothetical protein
MPIKSPQSLTLPVSILAGIGSSLIVVSISEFDLVRSSRSPQVADRSIGQSPRFCAGRRFANANELPLVAPIVSSDSTSDRSDLSTTAEVTAKKQQPSPLQSAHVALKQAKVAVTLSQAQLAQARTNLIEFRAKHNSTKILSAQGKVSRQHADKAKAAYQLAQSQHKSASIGLQESQTQLIAAQAEVSKLGRKANAVKQM